MSILKFSLTFIFLLSFSQTLYGQENPNTDKTESNNLVSVEDFIKVAYTPTFDCPPNDYPEKIDSYLAQNNLSNRQRLTLTSMRTHSHICAGEQMIAQEKIQRLLEDENADKNAQYYLSAIYQYGFIYDLQESPERCDYYALSRDAAKNKYADIHLSASLGYITECKKGLVNEQLFSMHDMLETIKKMKNKAALAHAYNRIGLYYASLNQYSLAANQYLQAYEIAKDIYTDENKLALLASAVTALTVSDNFERAEQVLKIYKDINQNVNTTQSNFLQFVNESNYYNRSKQYEKLKETIKKWAKIKEKINNPFYSTLFNLYNAEVCYIENDIDCLKRFLMQHDSADKASLKFASGSSIYLKLILKVHVLLGNTDEALQAIENYSEKEAQRRRLLHDFVNNTNVTEMHKEILNLESSLKEQNEDRRRLVIFATLMLSILVMCVIWIIRRNYIQKHSFDSLTGFMNELSIKTKLTQLPVPVPKHTHSLVIFDVSIFSKTNLTNEFLPNDIALGKIAESIADVTRAADLLGRLSSNKLIFCLTNIEENTTQAFFERTKAALINRFKLQNASISLENCMSVYYSTEKFGDIDEVIKNMLLSLNVQTGQG